MKAVRYALAFAALTAVAIILVQQNRGNAQLTSEIDGLRRQNREFAALRAENERLIAAERTRATQTRAEQDELMRLRSQIAAARAQIEQQTKTSDPSTEPGWKPAANWANLGNSTPAAAFETNLWAVVNKQPDVLLTTLELSEAARAKLAAYYQRLPEAERAKYATPELMYATFMLESQGLTWTGMRVMDQMENGSGEIILTTKWQWADGRVRVNPRSLHRTADGWKMPLPDEAIERGLASVGNRASSGKQ